MNKRYLGVLMLSPLVIVLFVGGIYLQIATLVFSLLGMYEFYKVFNNQEFYPLKSFGYLLVVIYYMLIIFDKLNQNTSLFLIMLFIVFSFIFMVFDDDVNIIDISLTTMGFFYIAIPFSFLAIMSEKPYGSYFVWLTFIACWSCDSVAYYTGRFLGKTKLCPNISPNKTVEGAIGGLIGSVISVTLFGLYLSTNGVTYSILNYIILGLICGVVCQIGDLTASSIKRYSNVKDFSNLIPGHGGILDRFDSILLTSVVVYYYITIVLGL
ncbi:phosphatidate cytidylyltransferase [Clostridium sp. DL1XJH146]